MHSRDIVRSAQEKAQRRFDKLVDFFCPDSSMVRKVDVQAQADELRSLAAQRNEDDAAASRLAARMLERRYMRYAV